MRARVIVEKWKDSPDGGIRAKVAFGGQLTDEERGSTERRPLLVFDENGVERTYLPNELPDYYDVALDYEVHPTARPEGSAERTLRDAEAMRLFENFQCALREARGEPGGP